MLTISIAFSLFRRDLWLILSLEMETQKRNKLMEVQRRKVMDIRLVDWTFLRPFVLLFSWERYICCLYVAAQI